MDKRKLMKIYLIVAVVLGLCISVAVTSRFFGASGAASGEKKREYVEKAENYALYQANGMYYVSLYDTDGQTAKTDGPFVKQPQIKSVDGRLLRVSYQAGVGMGAQFAYYYDVGGNRFSQTFQSVFDEYGDLVAYCRAGAVIVQNIFDPESFYLEINEFEKPFSHVAFPFDSIRFTDGGSKLSITYFSGDDHHPVTEEKIIENRSGG